MCSSLIAEPLWIRARASFARAIAAIGTPALIAVLTLSRELHRAITERLFRLEHVVRKLLLAEAAEIARSATWTAGLQTRICTSVKTKSAPDDARSKMDLVNPQAWRARFSFALPSHPRRAPHTHVARITNRASSAFCLARRLEAVRRVLDNPAPHAECLARVLVRAVRQFPDIVSHYWFKPSRTAAHDTVDEALRLDVYGACADASEAFTNSS